MKIKLLKSKIHRAIVTEANLDYIGSIGIDQALMKAANICEFEKVHVLDITNGSRIETYLIKGEKGSGEICVNGAAAHLIKKNHIVIIVAYCVLNESEIHSHNPVIVHVDKHNRITNAFPDSVLSLN